MSAKVRRYWSLFMLSIFLFAYTEKGIHDIIHGDRFDYLAQKGVHYQTPIHHCFLCNFSIAIAEDVDTYAPPAIACYIAVPIVFPYFEQQIRLLSLPVITSRGPPLSA